LAGLAGKWVAVTPTHSQQPLAHGLLGLVSVPTSPPREDHAVEIWVRVNTTVREANDRGYRCIVLADCCASYFPEFHDIGLKMIKAQGGIFGWVSDSERLLTAFPQTGASAPKQPERTPAIAPAE